MGPRSSPESCPVCGRNPIRPSRRYHGDRTAFECESCGVHFVYPLPTDEALSARYRFEVYGTTYASDTPATFDRRRSHVDRLLEATEQLGPRGTMLDVGCSIGTLLEVAKGRGWAVEGLERDPATAEATSGRLGVPVHVGVDLAAVPEGRRYDLILLSHVLEHVRDPPALLRQVRARLSPRGRVLLRLPNASSHLSRATGRLWGWYCPPIHLFYFDAGSLTRALEGAGLHATQISTDRGDARAAPMELLQAVARAVVGSIRRPAPTADGVEYAEGVSLRGPLRHLRDGAGDLLARIPWGDDDSELDVVASAPG